jgi:toxin YoeB
MEPAARNPFGRLGQPEPLKHRGPDVWSRRIDQEHRLIYVVFGDRIVFLAARGHYPR